MRFQLLYRMFVEQLTYMCIDQFYYFWGRLEQPGLCGRPLETKAFVRNRQIKRWLLALGGLCSQTYPKRPLFEEPPAPTDQAFHSKSEIAWDWNFWTNVARHKNYLFVSVKIFVGKSLACYLIVCWTIYWSVLLLFQQGHSSLDISTTHDNRTMLNFLNALLGIINLPVASEYIPVLNICCMNCMRFGDWSRPCMLKVSTQHVDLGEEAYIHCL